MSTMNELRRIAKCPTCGGIPQVTTWVSRNLLGFAISCCTHKISADSEMQAVRFWRERCEAELRPDLDLDDEPVDVEPAKRIPFVMKAPSARAIVVELETAFYAMAREAEGRAAECHAMARKCERLLAILPNE